MSRTLSVELHPTAMAWDEPRHRLFVANANSDTVSVIDTDAERVAATIPLRPFGLTLKGIAPTALVVAPDGAYPVRRPRRIERGGGRRGSRRANPRLHPHRVVPEPSGAEQ